MSTPSEVRPIRPTGMRPSSRNGSTTRASSSPPNSSGDISDLPRPKGRAVDHVDRQLDRVRWLPLVVRRRGHVAVRDGRGAEFGRARTRPRRPGRLPRGAIRRLDRAGLTDGPVGAGRRHPRRRTANPCPSPCCPSADELEVVLLHRHVRQHEREQRNRVGEARRDRLPRRAARRGTGRHRCVLRYAIAGEPTRRPTVQRCSARSNQLRAAWQTSLYDGIVFGNSLFSGATDDRQFVLLSDGGDTSSAATLEDALAVTSEVRTNAIEIVTSESNSDALAQLASGRKRPSDLDHRSGGTERALPGDRPVARRPLPSLVHLPGKRIERTTRSP